MDRKECMSKPRMPWPLETPRWVLTVSWPWQGAAAAKLQMAIHRLQRRREWQGGLASFQGIPLPVLPPEDLPLCSQLAKVPGTEEVFGQCVVSDERLGRGGRKGRNACTLEPAESF